MKIIIREVDHSTIQHVKTYGSSFEVRSKLLLSAENGKISYTLVDVPPYIKQYEPEHVDPAAYVDNPDRVVFFAHMENQLAGQIRVLRSWNKYAYIDDIAVDPNHRRQGIGRALILRCIEWAKRRNFPGITLETQNINVPACKLYESCGFELRGFDTHLYKALDPSSDEIALYWYLMF